MVGFPKLRRNLIWSYDHCIHMLCTFISCGWFVLYDPFVCLSAAYLRAYVYITYVLSGVFEFLRDDDDLGSGGFSALNIAGPMVTGNTIWYNDVLNCVGNEVCLARCLLIYTFQTSG